MISDRALACIISLAYDRHVAGEDDRALACYRELAQQLAEKGYHSYRLPVGLMSGMGESGPYADLLQRIKQTLDPGGILAPGRYTREPGQNRRDTEPAHSRAASTVS
jgi:4-cresol dehydrogenase (hydroxylating)